MDPFVELVGQEKGIMADARPTDSEILFYYTGEIVATDSLLETVLARCKFLIKSMLKDPNFWKEVVLFPQYESLPYEEVMDAVSRFIKNHDKDYKSTEKPAQS